MILHLLGEKLDDLIVFFFFFFMLVKQCHLINHPPVMSINIFPVMDSLWHGFNHMNHPY